MKSSCSFSLLPLLLSFLILETGVAYAEDAYKWTDPSGRTIYGSRPAKNARGAEKITTRKLSRYSSKKVLERMGTPTLKEETLATSASSPSAATSPTPVKARNLKLKSVALSPGEVQLEQDPEGQVTLCKAEVENKNESEVREISVAFEFPDGTLVPGLGPENMPAQSKAFYEIPPELVPLRLKKKSDEDSESLAQPRVIVHGVSE